MTRRDDVPEEVPEDLANAYRALPPAEPSAELDARVRTAVKADLDATRPARRNIFKLPRRIPMLSFATAAAVFMTVGVGYLVMQQHPPTEVASPAETVVMTQPEPKLEADYKKGLPSGTYYAPALAPPVAIARTRSAPPTIKLDMPAPSVEPPPPPAPRYEANAVNESPELAEVAVAAREAPAAVATPITLDNVRALLRDGKRAKARTLLLRWQSQNHDAAIPDDLRPLLNEDFRP